ncbi:MAG: hypothetical protein UDD86_07355 [Sodaliphilus sp.]|nr:hypothetical protein [Sodaliphilus sp.]
MLRNAHTTSSIPATISTIPFASAQSGIEPARHHIRHAKPTRQAHATGAKHAHGSGKQYAHRYQLHQELTAQALL